MACWDVVRYFCSLFPHSYDDVRGGRRAHAHEGEGSGHSPPSRSRRDSPSRNHHRCAPDQKRKTWLGMHVKKMSSSSSPSSPLTSFFPCMLPMRSPPLPPLLLLLLLLLLLHESSCSGQPAPLGSLVVYMTDSVYVVSSSTLLLCTYSTVYVYVCMCVHH